MTSIAIIGGTGLTSLEGLEITSKETVSIPYGDPSGSISKGKLSGKDILFLPRHGYDHSIPPHKVNYRANIDAIKQLGAEYVIAVNAVGGITDEMQASTLSIPDQLIDYTWGREHTYYEGGDSGVEHIDFTHPYCETLRKSMIAAASQADIAVFDYATYAVTQGPRLETPAEINKYERDGCHIVGMTAMPEASLAREKDLCYASIAVVANMAAGRGVGEITMEEINLNLETGMDRVRSLLSAVISSL
ncbi:MAG: S-methyl-5'-thioinosine phosphorylase [Gammaproteobacteria bacterium]|nr:S-methyl-5'-thioinosine phosphorylase [Gammaproteobacteria bacterium]